MFLQVAGASRHGISLQESDQREHSMAAGLSQPTPGLSRPLAPHIDSQPATLPPPQPPSAPLAPPAIPQASGLRPKYPEFAQEATRMKSFEGKIIPRGQDIRVLANAGFYHVG